VVVHVYNLGANSSTDISIQWAHLAAPMKAGSKPATVAIPGSALAPKLPPLEVKRRELQDALKVGWSTWSYNMLGVVRLPDSSVLTTALCQLSTQDCLLQTHIEDPAAQIRVGVFAADASYWQFYLGYKGVNVSLSYSGGSGPLNVLAEPQSCAAPVNCSDYALVILPRFAWFRNGDVTVDNATGTVTLAPMGMPNRVVQMTGPNEDLTPHLPRTLDGYPLLSIGLGKGAVGMQEKAAGAVAGAGAEASAAPTVAAISQIIAAARAKEYASYAKFGKFATVKEAVQAATMWNYIYTPAEYGPFLPVSRQWDFVKGGVNSDWAYVIFDW